MTSFEKHARKICIALVETSKGLRLSISNDAEQAQKGKQQRVKGILELANLLFDTTVSQNCWLDSNLAFKGYLAAPFIKTVSCDSTLFAPTKQAIDELLLALNFSYFDNSQHVRIKWSPIGQPIERSVGVQSYVTSLESIMNSIDSGCESAKFRWHLNGLISSVILGRGPWSGSLDEQGKHFETRRKVFNQRLDKLDTLIVAMRDSLRPTPFLNLIYEDGILNRIGFRDSINLNKKPLQKLLFEQCFCQKGNPTASDKMVDLIYGERGKEGHLSSLKGELNKSIDQLKIGVDSNYRLEDIQPEDLSV